MDVTRSRTKRTVRFLSIFILHQLIATIGVMVVAGFLTFAVLSHARASSILTTIPYFPIQLLVAILIGAVLQIYLRHSEMKWVWVLPLVLLTIGFFSAPFSFSDRITMFFGSICTPANRCFYQTGLTLPFYTTVAYTLAAFLISKLRGKGISASEKQNATA